MATPRIHILQHTSRITSGTVEDWLKQNNLPYTVTNFEKGDPLPPADQIDWLIVLGGPMSVNDEDKYPWLKPEKLYIQQVIQQETPVLGLCLGSQLIANALGGPVSRRPEHEVGFHAIRSTGQTHPLWQGWPDELKVFLWHEDAFAIPPGAVHLAGSDGWSNQAYGYGNHVIAVQFHPEADSAWVDNCMQSLEHHRKPGPHSQSPEEVQKQIQLAQQVTPHFWELLDRFRKIL